MVGKSKRSKLVLTPEEAQILWRYHAGETVTEIARALQMTRKSVGKWIDRGLALGAKAALKDTYHRPPPTGDYRGGEGLGGPFGLLETQGAGLRGRTVDAEGSGPACASTCGRGGTSVF